MAKSTKKPKARKPVQHKGLPVPGYTPQSQRAIAESTKLKQLEEQVLRALDYLELLARPSTPINPQEGTDVLQPDGRCIAKARTEIQDGFMWANRAIFKPQRIRLPEDQA